MPLTFEIETNVRPWARRKLKRICGEVVMFGMFFVALWCECVLGFFRGIRVAYIDWQDIRYALNYRKRRE